MTRVGTDISLARVGDTWGAGPALLETLNAQGMEGVNIRTLTDLSPSLDRGVLDDFRQAATDLGMYVEVGIGKVNPYMTAEQPEVRALGDGDFIKGMERMIAAASAMGWRTLWTACAGIKDYPSPYDTDRARREAPWPYQLLAIRRLVGLMLPALREFGCTLAIETHEEITTRELVGLVEDVDDPCVGICFDPANPIARGEAPRDALLRVAPHVVSTQLRDVRVFPSPDGRGLTRFLRPCGEGHIDWREALDILLDARPDLNLTIEGTGGWSGRMDVPLADPAWRGLHPDFTAEDESTLRALADRSVAEVAVGKLAPFDKFDNNHADHRGAHDRFVGHSAAHLRAVLAKRAPV